MSSQASSSTEQTPAPSFLDSPDTISPTLFTSFRNLSETDILQNLCMLLSKGIHYLGDKNINDLCVFVFNNNMKGDMLVLKGSQKPYTKFIVTGIFRINPRNFFMISDGRWMSMNTFNSPFEQVKISCQLCPLEPDSGFDISIKNFPTVLSNIWAIESLANPRKTHQHHSILCENPTAIKLSHLLFIVCLSYCNLYSTLQVSKTHYDFHL